MSQSFQEGFIIHWGVYAVPAYNPPRKNKPKIANGSEWYYKRLKQTFLYGTKTIEHHSVSYGDRDYYDFLLEFEQASVDWKPQQWMDIIKEAGGQYAILTAKHHDGVVLYPSSIPGHNTQRDYVGEFIKSCRDNGIQAGIYYSLLDWDMTRSNPFSTGKKKITNYVNRVLHLQLKEIVEKYDPDIIWSDGDWNHTTDVWRSDEFLSWWFDRRPDGITNNRWGKDFMIVSKWKDRAYMTGTDRLLKADASCPLWEHVGTVGQSWGYATNDKYRTKDEIQKDVSIVKANGGSRFTINIGPKPNGSVSQGEINAIRQLFK